MHKRIQQERGGFEDALPLSPMRTTVTFDDHLLSRAQELSGLSERSQLLRQALVALVERESARRLAALGASEPQLRAIPGRRPPAP